MRVVASLGFAVAPFLRSFLQLTATVKPRKDWNTYELLDLGMINLNQVGTVDCTVGFEPVDQ